MIDSHCHILSNIDDGSRDMDESIEMAKIAEKDGIKKIIATPHVNDNRFSPADIADRVEQLNRLLNKQNIEVQVFPGAEVSITLPPDRILQYTLSHSPHVLIEFPHDHLPSYAVRMLEWLSAKGLKPIIAHPERNYSIIRSPEIYLNLLNNNIYTQITADSITGAFGRDIQYCAHFLIESGKIDLVASDAHSKKFRQPILSAAAEALARKFGKKASRQLVETNPSALLKGEEISRD